MLFNSYEFIFVFLPLTFLGYFFLNKKGLESASKGWLVFCSLFFYSWWKLTYLPLILISILFNFVIGNILARDDSKRLTNKRSLLILGITGNIALLAYFKYTDFFIHNINLLSSLNIKSFNLVLPLAISFFTFQQIAYLVDSYRGETKEYDFLNYTLFVSFFPQLIAGPIVHHKEMMPQFKSKTNKSIHYRNIVLGLYVFFIGLFKKVIVADTFSIWAVKGFENAGALTIVEAWATSLSYTFQLYFDFSGYTDMALGAALIFNINIPLNFNSPYKATNIRDFWQRWHMTLSRFMRDYIYIPLGGNREGELVTYRNVLVTFLIGGLWHGAGWTFVFWGGMHGIALIVQRLWEKVGVKLHIVMAWFITFNFVNLSWIFFRAEKWNDAIHILRSMFGFKTTGLHALPGKIVSWSDFSNWMVGVLKNIDGGQSTIAMLVVFFLISVFAKNSMELKEKFEPNWKYGFFIAVSMSISLVYIVRKSEFLYFNF